MIELLLTYKYAIFIPLVMIDGSIVVVIAGFLVTMGVFNPFLVYVVTVLSDVLRDGVVYLIGRSGKRFLRYFKVTDEKLEKAKTFFHENHKKAIITFKLLHGIGFTGLMAAGASHVPYKRYLKTCALISVVQSLVILLIGIMFGNAYVVIGKYLNYYAAVTSVIALVFVLILFIRKYRLGTKTTL